MQGYEGVREPRKKEVGLSWFLPDGGHGDEEPGVDAVACKRSSCKREGRRD